MIKEFNNEQQALAMQRDLYLYVTKKDNLYIVGDHIDEICERYDMLYSTRHEVFYDTRYWVEFNGDIVLKNKDITIIENLEFPYNLKNFDMMFNDCHSLEQTTNLPNMMNTIGFGMFCGCNSLNYIDIPNNIKSIEVEAFRDCTSLTSIELPNNIKSIGASAFRGCTSLTSISIPEGCERIEYCAFFCCERLEQITLPASLKKIDLSSFLSCPNLKFIFFAGTEERWRKICTPSTIRKEFPRNIKVICNSGD